MADSVPDEVEALLTGGSDVAHLATCTDGQPHSAPLWFRYEDGRIELLTTGRKLENVRRNPRVSLSVQHDEDGHPDWMVTVQGTATVIEDEDTVREANRRLNRKYGADEDSWSENELVRVDVGTVAHKTW